MNYDDTAGSYSELHGDEQLAKLKIIKENINPGKNDRLLDVGCGTGLSSGFECFVVGVDLSIGMLRHNLSEKKILASAEMLPFKSGTFDYVISVTAIHNFAEIGNSISEIKRVGKNHFVLSVLRKSKKYNLICSMLRENFGMEKSIEDDKDTIFFCSKS